ncbi:MAG: hypothetical protein P8183_02810 [Anaerolineae bacterium]|jgi:hypothetical protein
MKRHELIDLLADHADALNEGAGYDDVSAGLTNGSSVVALLQLAQAVKRVLVPVSPSPFFQLELKGRLLQDEDSVGKRPLPKTIWLGAAVSVVGLAIFLLRRVRPGDGGVATAV